MARKKREASLKRFAKHHPKQVILRSLPGMRDARLIAKLLDALTITYTFEEADPSDLPVTLIVDDLRLHNPSREQILHLFPQPPILREGYDVAIVGGGWSGIAAARTAAALGLDVVLLEEHTLLYRIQPSFELVERMRESLTREGITFTEGARVKRLKPVGRLWEVSTDGAVYRARSIILALGGMQPLEGLPGSQLTGVFWHLPPVKQAVGRTCAFLLATPEAYRLTIPFLSVCEQTFILDMEDARGSLSKTMSRLFEENTSHIYPYSRILRLTGDDQLEAIRFSSADKIYQREVDLLISIQPLVHDTHWLKPLGILSQEGMIRHDWGVTSLPGVFVAGRAAARFALNSEARKASGSRAGILAAAYVRDVYKDLPVLPCDRILDDIEENA